MSDNKILDALRELDTTNDNHWTTDGQARLDTVKMLAGDPSLTREKVEQAAPGFNKQTAATYKAEGESTAGTQGGQQPEIVVTAGMDSEGAATPQPEPLPTAPAADGLPTANEPTAVEGATPLPGTQNVDQASETQPGAAGSLPPEIAQGTTMQGVNTLATPESDLRDALASTAPSPNAPPELGGEASSQGVTNEQGGDGSTEQRQGETQLSAVDRGTVGDPDEVEALEAELEATVEQSNKLRDAADRANGKLTDSVQRESYLRQEIEKARPRTGTMTAIQQYFAKQDEVVDKVAQTRKQITDMGIDFGELKKLMEGAPVGGTAN